MISMLRPWVLLLCCLNSVAYGQTPPATQGCGAVVFVSPTREEPIVATARLTLRWQSIQEAKRYRVRLRSQIPNGEILHDIDAVTHDTQFTPAVALAEQQAIIRVQIIPDCDPQFAASAPPDFRSGEAFVFDSRKTCETPLWILRAEATTGSETPATRTLHWQQNASARSYELTLFAGEDARVLSRQMVQGLSYPLSDASSQSLLVASLRARCEHGWSDVVQTRIQPAIKR